jgi:hypothetical protein
MMRFVGRLLVLAAVVIGFAGCDGGGDLAEGQPQNTEYRVPVMPESMKGANMRPKVIPKAGTPGNAAAAAPGAK